MTLDRLLAGREMAAATFGLERIRAMLHRLGRPDRAYRVAHVAGTNGKGSTAAMLSAILGVRHRVGLFTSPHLTSVRERFVVQGTTLSREILDDCAERVLPAARDAGASYFEAATALACLAFAEADVEWAVFEAGLGGRLDATNALEPALTLLTPIALDHQAYLGSTLAEIAAEKAGVLKPAVPAFAADLAPAAREVVMARAGRVGAPLRILGAAEFRAVRTDWEGTCFQLRDGEARWREFETTLVGAHQGRNAALAVLSAECGAGADEQAIRKGLTGVRLPGRLERLDSESGTWLLDVAHNPAGLEALADALTIPGLPLPIVCLTAILGDKPWRRMLIRLSELTKALVLTVAPSAPPERRWSAEEVRSWAAERGAETEFTADLDQAMKNARMRAGPGTVLVTGSFHTVGDARARLPGSDAD